MRILEMILLVVLPFGTALVFGALTDRVSKSISGWCSLAGLALGVYFFHKSMEFLGAG